MQYTLVASALQNFITCRFLYLMVHQGLIEEWGGIVPGGFRPGTRRVMRDTIYFRNCNRRLHLRVPLLDFFLSHCWISRG